MLGSGSAAVELCRRITTSLYVDHSVCSQDIVTNAGRIWLARLFTDKRNGDWSETPRAMRPLPRKCVALVRPLLIALLGPVPVAGVHACSAARAPTERRALPTIVYDVTQLNPIRVSGVLVPTTTEEIVDAIVRHQGPISIGGARHSMGGQTAIPGAVQIDMRHFDRILAFDPAGKTITVQTGIRWRQIQERIDSANLSVKIMQAYANFTVGGSLSVNAHGRYVGFGPIVSSVRAIKMVLATGEVVEASRSVRRDVFDGAIGGYGALGVITEATLELAENVRLKREQVTMPVRSYPDYFFRHIRDADTVVFHNGDIYPNDYTTVHAESYVRTSEPLTVTDRLTPRGQSYRLNRLALWIVSEWSFGKDLRRQVIDPWRFRGPEVAWRNYIASSNADQLEPASRASTTYVLEEYFVPVERFNDFVPAMRAIFRRYRPNILNVSIRHAKPDSETILSWAPREVFSFVIYYKQKTDRRSQREVGEWTRELIDVAVRLGGSYYLPYQLHATREQFLRAYPRAPEFFALKRRLDPTNKFQNMLWDKFYQPRSANGPSDCRPSESRVWADRPQRAHTSPTMIVGYQVTVCGAQHPLVRTIPQSKGSAGDNATVQAEDSNATISRAIRVAGRSPPARPSTRR